MNQNSAEVNETKPLCPPSPPPASRAGKHLLWLQRGALAQQLARLAQEDVPTVRETVASFSRDDLLSRTHLEGQSVLTGSSVKVRLQPQHHAPVGAGVLPPDALQLQGAVLEDGGPPGVLWSLVLHQPLAVAQHLQRHWRGPVHPQPLHRHLGQVHRCDGTARQDDIAAVGCRHLSRCVSGRGNTCRCGSC